MVDVSNQLGRIHLKIKVDGMQKLEEHGDLGNEWKSKTVTLQTNHETRSFSAANIITQYICSATAPTCPAQSVIELRQT